MTIPIITEMCIRDRLIGAINIFSMITQTGILSYSDKFGFGYSGYYADGNALGVYMVLALSLIHIWHEKEVG